MRWFRCPARNEEPGSAASDQQLRSDELVPAAARQVTISRVSDRLRLADLLGGLSIVADMGFGLPPETAMRACVIGTGLARKLELPEQEVVDTFYSTLLLHIGCTALSHETAAVFGDDLTVNSAVAKTNFADPRDVFRTMIPEAARGMPPLGRARAAAFIVAR